MRRRPINLNLLTCPGLGQVHTRSATQAHGPASGRRKHSFRPGSQPHLPPQYMRPTGRRAASLRGDAPERSLCGLGRATSGRASAVQASAVDAGFQVGLSISSVLPGPARPATESGRAGPGGPILPC